MTYIAVGRGSFVTPNLKKQHAVIHVEWGRKKKWGSKFSRKMPSEHRTQKLRTDDLPLPRTGQYS